MTKARLLVELDVKPGERDAFVAMFVSEFIERSRKEDGCEQYELWHDPSTPTKMTIVEVWQSKTHLDNHLAQQWFSEWAPRMEAMLAAPPEVRSLNSVED